MLKRDGATRQREEWHLDIFQAKEVEVYDVPQEKLQVVGVKKIRSRSKCHGSLAVRNAFRNDFRTVSVVRYECLWYRGAEARRLTSNERRKNAPASYESQ